MPEPAESKAAPAPEPTRRIFDQDAYVRLHPDVAAAIANGIVGSAWQHYTLHGKREGREWISKPDSLAGVSLEIAPGDEMHIGNKDHYFDVGESALHCIESALFAARVPRSSIATILDLPCGYGRVLRFLRKAFPESQITACDLLRDGVDFCAKAFNAVPVYSHADPRRIPLAGTFDLIWCGSLLTHLSLKQCDAFLEVFARRLNPNGILAFTLHGRQVESELVSGKNRCGLDDAQIKELLRGYRRTGFGYVDYRDSPGYGISLAAPSFVAAEFLQGGSWTLVTYQEAAWDGRQDFVAVR